MAEFEKKGLYHFNNDI